MHRINNIKNITVPHKELIYIIYSSHKVMSDFLIILNFFKINF